MLLTHDTASPCEPIRLARIDLDDNGVTYSVRLGAHVVATRLDYFAARDMTKRRGYHVEPTLPGRKES